MKILMFCVTTFIFCNLESSESSDVFSWIQTTLLQKKIRNMLAVSESSRKEYLEASYANRTFEDLSFVRNDKLDVSRKKISVRYYNPNFVKGLGVKQDQEQVVVSSSLALKHFWVSPQGSHYFYYLLRESNFESCPVSCLYEKLLVAVDQKEES